MEDTTRLPDNASEDGDEDIEAVREAIAEWRAGDPGLPLDAAFDQARRALRAEPDEDEEPTTP